MTKEKTPKTPKKPGRKPFKPTIKSKIVVTELMAGIASENSILAYAKAWEQYLEYGRTASNCLNHVTLAKWRQHMIVNEGRAASTVNLRLVAIKSIARELYAQGDLDKQVYWDIREVRILPKTALKERRRPNNRTRVEPEQMRAICTAPPVSSENVMALRDRALMMTLASTGMRISEACNVKFNDIKKLPNGSCIVEGVMGKRKSEPRIVPLAAEAYEAILDWIEFRPVSSPYVFTTITYSSNGLSLIYSDRPLNRHTATAHIKAYAESCGVPNVTSHDFRRFVGTQLAKKNLRQAQLVLGHSSITTTANYYIMDEVEVGITEGIF